MMSMSARPDAELVQAAQAGDVGSFELLYARYAPVVHSILLGRLPAPDADDVTQNVFITAYTKLISLREAAAFAGWIARIARNAAKPARPSRRPFASADAPFPGFLPGVRPAIRV